MKNLEDKMTRSRWQRKKRDGNKRNTETNHKNSLPSPDCKDFWEPSRKAKTEISSRGVLGGIIRHVLGSVVIPIRILTPAPIAGDQARDEKVCIV